MTVTTLCMPDNGLPAQLARVFQEVLSIPDRVGRVEQCVDALRADITQYRRLVDERLSEIERSAQASVELSQALQAASRLHEQQSAEHYARTTVEPLARSVALVIDILEDGLRAEFLTEPQGVFIEGLRRQLVALLGVYDVEVFTPALEARFDARTMRVVKVVETEDAEKDKTVARVVRRCYRYGARIVRPAKVCVYKLAANGAAEIGGAS